MVHATTRNRLLVGATLIALVAPPVVAPWSAGATEYIQNNTTQVTALPQGQVANLALNDFATVSASGTEAGTQWQPERAVDGDKGKDFAWRDKGENFRSPNASRWSAENGDEGWLAVDLGAEANLDHVTVT